MIDYKPSLVTLLQTVLDNVEYELFCDSKTEIPCITYRELDNRALADGDTVRHSELGYAIKIWANDLATIMTYAQEVDKVMKGAGFKRTSSTELTVSNTICKIINYTAYGIEIEETI